MAATRAVLCFILGLATGVLTWLAAQGQPQPGDHPAHPDATLVANVHAADSGPAPALAPDADVAPGSAGPDASSAAPAPLHLWEALALRGAPAGSEGTWFRPPGLGASSDFGSRFGPPPADAPLNPAFVEFYDLTADEQRRVTALVHETLRRQHELDLAHLQPLESKFRFKDAIVVPGYAEESAALRQSYEAGLRDALGDARYQVYRDWSSETFIRDFPGLAGIRREYHWIPTGQNPGGDYRVGIVCVAMPEGSEWTGYHSTHYFPDVAAAEQAAQLPFADHFPAVPENASPATTPAP